MLDLGLKKNCSCSSYGTTGIIRAPRGDGKKAIISVTPYDALKSSHDESASKQKKEIAETVNKWWWSAWGFMMSQACFQNWIPKKCVPRANKENSDKEKKMDWEA